MLKRYEHNPILQAHTDLPWCSIKVYNSAIIKEGHKYCMLFRAIGDDWISRIGYAESGDGINFEIQPSPVLTPSYPWEVAGCEDPRLVHVEGKYWVSYTAFDGITAKAALTSSPDLTHYDERKLIFPHWDKSTRANVPPDWSKAAAIFPQKIEDQYFLLFGDSHIWSASSTNLTDWTPSDQPVLSCRPGEFDGVYVEMGPPPILTDHGWLIIYHGVDRLDPQMTYRIGAALIDKDVPTKVIWRCNQPFMEPEESHEVVGFIDVIEGGFARLKNITLEELHKLAGDQKLPKAIFCCGAVMEDKDTLRFYYGASDTVICTATIDLETIFQS